MSARVTSFLFPKDGIQDGPTFGGGDLLARAAVHLAGPRLPTRRAAPPLRGVPGARVRAPRAARRPARSSSAPHARCHWRRASPTKPTPDLRPGTAPLPRLARPRPVGFQRPPPPPPPTEVCPSPPAVALSSAGRRSQDGRRALGSCGGLEAEAEPSHSRTSGLRSLASGCSLPRAAAMRGSVHG